MTGRHLQGDQAEAYADALERAQTDFAELIDLAVMQPARPPAEWLSRRTMITEAGNRMLAALKEAAVIAIGPELAARLERGE